MKSQYVDNTACLQVIGNVYLNPSLLDNDNLFFNEEDFTEEFHKIVFGAIYNLIQLGAEKVDIATIEDYLKDKPKSFATYQANKGGEWIEKVQSVVQVSTFMYYYQRMKKMTLLREYNKIGVDLTWLYDKDNILDLKKKQMQEEWLDNTPLEKIADLIDDRISNIRAKYVNDDYTVSVQAGKGAMELLERLKASPEFGIPMYGPLINTVTRGARLGKFYLRSGSTGSGKSRSMIADACYFACDEYFNIYTNSWEKNGLNEPTMFITTEQEEDEIQTMMLAFLAGVNEENIITGQYGNGEWERVVHAVEVLNRSPLYIKRLPDFSLQDIEMTIKSGIREHGVRYFCHDYIHSSMKILSEISSKAGVKGLREDNILFMISVRLKDLCVENNVFIMSATQLNGNYVDTDTFDQNLLRGAKSIADKIDVGMILLQVTQKDVDALEPLIQNNGLERPTIKLSIYKNRRGRHKGVLLWCKSDLGTCRIEPLFMTNYSYEYIELEDTKISVTTTIEPPEKNPWD
jgi:replicative DNA helicase